MEGFSFKSPWIIGGGILLVAIVILRGSSSSNQSQAVQYSSDISPNQLQLANINAQQNIAVNNSNTALQLQSLNNQSALSVAYAQEVGNILGIQASATGQNLLALTNGIVNSNLAMINGQNNVNVVGLQTRAGVQINQIQAGLQSHIADLNASIANNNNNNNFVGGLLGNVLGSATKVAPLLAGA